MKKIIYFAIPAIVATAIIGCSKESLKPQHGSIQSTSSSSSQARLSDVQASLTNTDLFVGIFYLKGTVADQVDALANLKTQLNNGELNLLSDRADNVVAYLNANQPEFFDNFGKLIRSGDQQNVLKAIDFAINTLTANNLDWSSGPHIDQNLEAGKRNCAKWIIIKQQIIRTRVADSEHPVIDSSPTILLEKEVLVNSIVESISK